jgi:carbonic anhydrase
MRKASKTRGSRQPLSRRDVLLLGGSLMSVGVVVAACGSDSDSPETLQRPATPDEALALLREGNERYAASNPSHPNTSEARRAEVAQGQEPWGIVWGCIDSRVPPELLFDVGLGDLFVVRTAGQVSDHASLGSVEFGAGEFDVSVIVVLAHERCGAVTAAIEAVESNAQPADDVGYIVDAIRPVIEAASDEPGDLTENVVRANVALQVESLGESPPVRERLDAGTLRVVGARYDLEDGTVEFLA